MENTQNHEQRISNLETKMAVMEAKVDNVKEDIKEIKSGIKQITDKMDERSQKPSQFLWAIGGSIVAALIIAGLKFI